MCILSLDVKRALAVAVPSALKVYLAPGPGLAQAVRAGLPPGTKEPQVQQAIQAATAEADKAKVSGGNQQAYPVAPTAWHFSDNCGSCT